MNKYKWGADYFTCSRTRGKEKTAQHIFFLEIETSELLDNAKHAFNILSVAQGGNLYQHLLS